MTKYILISFLITSLIASLISSQEETLSPSEEEYYIANAPDDEAYEPVGEHYEAAPSPADEYNEKMLEAIPKERMNFLKSCSTKMTMKCGREVFYNIVEKNDLITKKCCTELLKMGYECHDGLIKVMFSMYELKNNATYGLTRSKKAWNKCVTDAGAEIGSPVSLVY